MNEIHKEINELQIINTSLANDIKLAEQRIAYYMSVLQSKQYVYDENNKNIELLKKHMHDLEMFDTVKFLPQFELLTPSDMILVSKAIDKTDYRPYGVKQRYLDLYEIVRNVLRVKKQNPLWKLVDFKKIEFASTIAMLPPKNSYTVTYVTEHGIYMSFTESNHSIV